MAMSFDKLMKTYETKASEATAANLKRYEESMAIFDEIISRYSPGGAFEERALGQLRKQKVRDVGAETQQLISSGLYGTTTMGGTGRRWEESVGAPQRLALEDIQMQRLSQAQVGKAGAITAREDIAPDAGLYASLMQSAASRPGIVSAPAVSRDAGIPQQFGSFGPATPGWGLGGGGTPTSTSGGAYTGGTGVGTGTAPPPTGGVDIPMATGGDRAYYGAAYKPGGEVGSKTIAMQHYSDRGTTKTKTVQVPLSALGSGPGGFKDERTYLQYMPSGYSPYRD